MAKRSSRTRAVNDPKAWRALAHPVRLRILEQLAMHDCARAADLAVALDEPPNSVSFHLRQLARFGYVEPDDAPRSDGRERWWRSTSPQGFRIDKTDQDPAAAAALVAVLRQHTHDQVDGWYDAVSLPDDARAEEPRIANFDVHLSLTADEREEFLGELGEVLERWMGRSRSASVEGAERDEYVLFGHGLPQSAYDEVRRRRAEG